MASELGAWLRRQREDRGWTRSEMARRLIEAARARGDTSVPGADHISHNIYRWERGIVTPAERYRYYYCSSFNIPVGKFGNAAPGDPPPAPADNGSAASRHPVPKSEPDASAIRRAVLLSAHQGGEHAERAEQRGVGEVTLDQFRADAGRLAVQYQTGEPYLMFREMRRVRNRILEALDRSQWPRDRSEMYLLAGCCNALMAVAATNLGVPEAAEELTRSGWAYATIIDHHPLLGWLRLCGAYTAYWMGRPERSVDLARSGLEFLRDGEDAAQLHLHAGLAMARLGDAEGARRAIAAARDAREREHHDELLEIGGEFGFSAAAQAYYEGFTLAEAGDPAAAAALERATARYAAGPGPGEHHSRRLQMLAHTDLSLARLRSGALDAAAGALEPVLALAPGERTAVQVSRLDVLRRELTGTIYRGSPKARDLSGRIEDFTRQADVPPPAG
jgi:transcriptional regulator with XRE-family HTH domain